jgi:hypothetical protein
MPSQQKESTLARQGELLKILTKAQGNSKADGKWSKFHELIQQLNVLGYKVGIHTV